MFVCSDKECATNSRPTNRSSKGAGLSDAQIAFMGDDIVDLPLLRRAGVAFSVADGWEGVRAVADFVTAARGGHGAVREVAELLLKSQGQWSGLIAKIVGR